MNTRLSDQSPKDIAHDQGVHIESYMACVTCESNIGRKTISD